MTFQWRPKWSGLAASSIARVPGCGLLIVTVAGLLYIDVRSRTPAVPDHQLVPLAETSISLAAP